MRFYELGYGNDISREVDISDILSWPGVTAVKTAPVYAVQTPDLKKIETYTSDGILETTNIAEIGDFIVTQCNYDHTISVDSYGHKNTWVIKAAAFHLTYIPVVGNIYKPVPQKRIFRICQKDLEFSAPWNQKMIALKNDFLNVSDINNITRVSRDCFDKTYTILS